MLRFAPRAAEEAALVGAHREAEAQHARAASWLEGRADAVAAETDAAYELALELGQPTVGELACWRWRAGLLTEPPAAAGEILRQRTPPARARREIGSRTMSEISLLTGLRASIGAGTWLMPRLAGRLFGLDADANPQLPYVARLFGVRDAALAAGLQASSGQSRRVWLQLGIACDAADAIAGVLAGRRGELSPTSAVLVTVPALMGVALGISALQKSDGDPVASPDVG